MGIREFKVLIKRKDNEKYSNIQYIYFQNNSKEKLELIMDKVFIDDIFINKYLRIKYQTWNLPKERKV